MNWHFLFFLYYPFDGLIVFSLFSVVFLCLWCAFVLICFVCDCWEHGLLGGIGIIHSNMSIDDQAKEVVLEMAVGDALFFDGRLVRPLWAFAMSLVHMRAGGLSRGAWLTVGLGRIVALQHRSSSLYRIH